MLCKWEKSCIVPIDRLEYGVKLCQETVSTTELHDHSCMNDDLDGYLPNTTETMVQNFSFRNMANYILFFFNIHLFNIHFFSIYFSMYIFSNGHLPAQPP